MAEPRNSRGREQGGQGATGPHPCCEICAPAGTSLAPAARSSGALTCAPPPAPQPAPQPASPPHSLVPARGRRGSRQGVGKGRRSLRRSPPVPPIPPVPRYPLPCRSVQSTLQRTASRTPMSLMLHPPPHLFQQPGSQTPAACRLPYAGPQLQRTNYAHGVIAAVRPLSPATWQRQQLQLAPQQHSLCYAKPGAISPALITGGAGTSVLLHQRLSCWCPARAPDGYMRQDCVIQGASASIRRALRRGACREGSTGPAAAAPAPAAQCQPACQPSQTPLAHSRSLPPMLSVKFIPSWDQKLCSCC